jgi:hypothetical protein
VVQLGTATEDLNRRWYERNSGNAIKDVQRRILHPVHRWMGATLDGRVDPGGAVFEAKFMLPWTFSEEAAAEKHMAQLQHNMWVAMRAKITRAPHLVHGCGFGFRAVLLMCGRPPLPALRSHCGRSKVCSSFASP